MFSGLTLGEDVRVSLKPMEVKVILKVAQFEGLDR